MKTTQSSSETVLTSPPARSTYDRLFALLDGHGARYRVMDHRPVGITTVASALRGHDLGKAAKSIIARVKVGKKARRFVLAVIAGDHRVDFDKLMQLYGARDVCFAPVDTAEMLAGSVTGTIIPFSFRADLELVVDPGLLVHDEIFFNAARLDRSVALCTEDYVAIVQPRVEPIASILS